MRSLRVVGLVLLLALAACVPEAAPCSTQTPVCDAYEASCQQQMLDALACLQSGSGTTLMGSVEVWSPERAQQEVTSMATMLSAEQLALLTRQAAALALLRLSPEGWDPAAAAGAYIATIGAFYQPGEGSIVVISGPEPPPADAGAPDDEPGAVAASAPPHTGASTEGGDEAATRLIAHELTHLLRDSETGIASFYARAGTTFDRLLAARAIVEGEAQLYAELAVLEQWGQTFDSAALAQRIDRWKQDSLLGFEQVDGPVAMADRYLPYPYGFSYALSAYLQGGRRAVHALFDHPPVSTRQLTLGFEANEPFAGPWSEDGELASVASPLAPERYESLGALSMGMWLVDAFVQRTLPAPTHDLSQRVLSALRSDVLTLLYDREADATAACWRMRFADVASASAMSTLAPWPAHVAVRVEGRDVFFTASPSADTRAALAAVAYGPNATQGAATTTASELLESLGLAWVVAASPMSPATR